MWQGIVVCLSVVAAEDVTVKPLRGDPVRGTLVALDSTSVVVRTAEGELKWDAQAVQTLKPASASQVVPENRAAAPVYVEMTDDTLLHGTRVTLNAGKAVVATEEPGTAWEIPHRVLRSLRFRKQDEALQKQWNQLLSANATGDQLVVRKSNAAGGESAPATVVLDQLEGVVHAVSATGIEFEFDGDKIDVPLEKVEGIIFHQRQIASWPDPICRLRDVRGNEWQAKSVAYANGAVQVESVAGVRGQMAWDRVAEIDFTAGNLVFLSDLRPESVEWRPYLMTSATPPALAKWFSVRRDQATDGSAMTLSGLSYEKGLSLHSRTLLSYRLTKNYRHFQAVVGVDERFRGPANLKLVISGDERTLLTKDIRGSDPPFEMDLDISGVKRLKILVDFGEDRSDAGDHLLLCNARLTK